MENPHTKNLLVFGYGLSLILLFFGMRRGNVILVLLGVTMAMLTLWKIRSVEMIYVRWMKVAHVIGAVVTSVLLCVIYYAVFGIAGIILRIFKKDLLDRPFEPEKSTYWQKRQAEPFDKKRYTQQF